MILHYGTNYPFKSSGNSGLNTKRTHAEGKAFSMTRFLFQAMFCFYVVITVKNFRSLTAPLDVDAERRLHLADVIVDADVHAVDAGSGESVVQTEHVLIQDGQRAARRLVRHAVKT